MATKANIGNTKPLNIRTIQASVMGAAQYVQDQKIEISRTAITKFQYADKWPEKYLSYVGSETKNNQYTDPEKFFRVMHYKPQWYGRRFTFRPVVDSSRLIRQATDFALQVIRVQTDRYIQAPNVSGKPSFTTGAYGASFKLALDRSGKVGLSGLKLLNSSREIDNLSQGDTVGIYNVAPYASTSERNALYYARVTGIIYYAAILTSRKYPQLGIRFTYPRASDLPGALAKYNTPLLQIGTRDTVMDKITKPGKNLRRRKRLARSR